MLRITKILGEHSKLRLVISLIMIFTILLTFFQPSTTNAAENSNDRRMSLINEGKGAQESQGVADVLDSLTGDELKTLGVFISNYYVPFSTQVGAKGNDKDRENAKKDIVKALTETGSFSKSTAELIVEAVLKVSSQPKPLYFAYSTDGGDSYKSAKTDGKNGRQATYYEFLDQVTGYAYKSTGGSAYPDRDGDIKYSVFNDKNYGYKEGSKKNRGALFWDEQGGGKSAKSENLVFDWNPAKSEGGGQTASQTVMSIIYSYLDKSSVGQAFLDYTNDERGGKTESNSVTKLIESKKLQGTSIEKIYNHSMYAWTMWVDAFGNIIVDTGERQYVAVPAAMNPYVFKKGGKTEDNKDFGYGRAVPVNNLISIVLESQGKLTKKGTTLDNYSAKFNVGDISSNFQKQKFNEAMYIFPGNSQVSWNESGAWDWGSVTLDALTTQYGFNRYGLERTSDLGKWLKLGSIPSKTQRYTNEKIKGGNQNWGDTLYKMYPYGFNSKGNPIGDPNVIVFPRSGLNKNPEHYVIADLVAFDSLGMMTNADYKKHDGNPDTILKEGLWKNNKISMNTEGITDDNAFGERLASGRNKINTASNEVMKNYSSNLYVSYILAGLDGQDKAGFTIAFNHFPTFDGTTILNDVSPEDSMVENTQELMNLSYYFLHPTEGVDYMKRWFKTKVGAILVGWHDDMTGSNDSDNTTGLTRYVGFSGFTTMPSLNDMQWSNWMVGTYLSWGIYLIIAVVVIMVFYIAIGEISMQRAVLGIAMFSACLYLPPTAINSTVSLTNAVSDNIYSDKFLYWGIMQLQTYTGKVDELAEAGEEGKSEDYTRGLMNLQTTSNGMYSQNFSLGNGVTLKWMTPKKDNYLYQIQQELSDSTGGKSEGLSMLTSGLLKKAISGERYVESSNAVYLYRTFTDITNYSRFYYGNLMGDSVYTNGSVSHNIGDISQSLSTVGMGSQYNKYIKGTGANSLLERKEKGFINDKKDSINGSSNNKKHLKRIYAPLSSETVSKSANKDISKVKIGDTIGVSGKNFNATVRNFNNHQKNLKTQLGVSTSSETLASTSSFALYTESPYYYFSWFLYDNGMSPQKGSTDSFRKLMLGDNDSFFYNYDINKGSSGYGELKDYFDMGSLFTTVIPYLRTVNTPLVQWSSLYGTKPYMDIPTSEEDASKYKDKNSESYYKYWYNTSLARLFNTYTPWVDAMYDTKYAKPETIEYGGKKQRVDDPINPAYYKVRPMVFSESEMAYYGLKDYNLTTVERKIMKVQRETRKDLLQLMNYYSFDDNVLNSTAAMIMTFNFNKEFSENNALSEGFVQYPQGFELKNFSFDAYLRLILAEGTGEDLKSTATQTSIYDRVVEKSSILTGVLLVVGDVVSVYIMPVMKFIFLILIFVLSVLAIFVKAMRTEVDFKTVLWDSLMLPLVTFGLITVSHSFIVSLFMTNGATDVTGETSHTISLGDPSMTLILIILINLVVVAGYVWIVYKLIKNVISYGKLTSSIIGGVFSSAATLAGSTASKFSSTVQNRVFGGGGTKTPDSGAYNESPEDRGRRNIEPENSALLDVRVRDVNRRAYRGNVESTEIPSINIKETIEKGKERLNESKNENKNNEDIKNDRDSSARDKELEERKKTAEEVKNKYNLD